ncbi:hypothetical protein MMC13_004526 [Lambiella insularis]|nr:hypothetical protein [Lambiella insularis]
MATVAPATTSTDVRTITQTLTRQGNPVTTTFTTFATVTLTKSLPTPTESPQSQSQSGTSPSTIGAIVGSIIGFILLCALVYFCCLQRVDEPYEPDLDPEPGGFPEEKPKPSPVRVERRGGALVENRPRRKKPAIMNSARSKSHSRPEHDYVYVDD